MCEEFPSLSPSGALRELRRLPVGCLEEIIEARHYARAVALVEAADTPAALANLPRTELVRLARTIDMDLGREAQEQERNKRE